MVTSADRVVQIESILPGVSISIKDEPGHVGFELTEFQTNLISSS